MLRTVQAIASMILYLQSLFRLIISLLALLAAQKFDLLNVDLADCFLCAVPSGIDAGVHRPLDVDQVP